VHDGERAGELPVLAAGGVGVAVRSADDARGRYGPDEPVVEVEDLAARNGSQRPILMWPPIRSRAEVASGVPGAIAWARWRLTGSGSPSNSALEKPPGLADRSKRQQA